MKGTTIRNRQINYMETLPYEEDAIREISNGRPSLYGFMPMTPGVRDFEKNPHLDLYKSAGDIAYLTFTKDAGSAGVMDKDINAPLLDRQTRTKLLSYRDERLSEILEGSRQNQFKELCKLYSSDPEKYGGNGGPNLRETLMSLQFVRDWELYLKLMSGKEGALGKAEREKMFDNMRESATKLYKERDPRLYKELLTLIDKIESETEKSLAADGGVKVLMKSEWAEKLNSVSIKESDLRKAFYNLTIEATKKASWNAGKRKEALLDKDGIQNFFKEINKNAPEEVRRSNKTAEKQLNRVLDKYKNDKNKDDEESFSKKTFAVLCSTIAIDTAANAFSIGLTISDGDRIIYMNSNVTPHHGTDIKCAEMNMNGEIKNYIENIADKDYESDRDKYEEHMETERQEMDEAIEESYDYDSYDPLRQYETDDDMFDIFGDR